MKFSLGPKWKFDCITSAVSLITIYYFPCHVGAQQKLQLRLTITEFINRRASRWVGVWSECISIVQDSGSVNYHSKKENTVWMRFASYRVVSLNHHTGKQFDFIQSLNLPNSSPSLHWQSSQFIQKVQANLSCSMLHKELNPVQHRA